MSSNIKDIVTLDMGGGGKKAATLIEFISNRLSLKKFTEEGVGVESLDDGAILPWNYSDDYDVVLTTDSYTVTPLFFPGGNIGDLAACGTINDLTMMGAKPIAMTLALIIEEGLTFKELGKILDTFNDICQDLNIAVPAGDTKVMPSGTLNKLVINTAGIGIVEKGRKILDRSVQPGDTIIVTGNLGDHGFTMLTSREGLSFEHNIQTDSAPLFNLIKPILQYDIHAMKDPTRGGLASVLNEWTEKSENISIWIDEESLPISEEVKVLSDIFGIDPLIVANEGKAVIACAKDDAKQIVESLQMHPLGKNSRIIGSVKRDKYSGKVIINTSIGGHRILEKALGQPIPRVC